MEKLPPTLLESCQTNHGPMLLALGWTFLSVAIITVSLRLYFRQCHRGGIHADDWVMLSSLISGAIAVSYLTVLVRAGLGQHIYCIPPSNIPTALHASTLGQIFNILGIGLVKVSVCLTVIRIISHVCPVSLKVFLWTLLTFACLSHTAQILLFIVQCRPMRAIWHPELQKAGRAECFSPRITYLAGYVGFGLDAFTDLACATIPVVIINRLHMSRRTKTALCVLIGLGSLTAGCAIAKAVTLEGVFDHDYTFALTKPAVCTILEHLCGMILASLPALRTMFGSLLSSSGSRGNLGRSSGRGTPPWWGRRSTPVFECRNSWIGKRVVSGLRKKEKGSFSGSEDTTVVALAPSGTRGAHKPCGACGGTGRLPQQRTVESVGWDPAAEQRDISSVQDPEGWPLRALNTESKMDVRH